MLNRLLRPLIGKLVMHQAGRLTRRFNAAAARAPETQREVLLAKLARNAESRFGREHDFASIRTVGDFRKAVPIGTYEDHAPYIEAVKAGKLDALFGPGQRVHMFAMSSGTTANPKYIPITDAFLDEYRRGWLIWGMRFFVDHRWAMFKPIVQLVSSPDEARTEAGIPCGSISGLIATMQKRLVRGLYCVPPVVGGIHDTRAKYYTALRMGISEPVVFLTSANPNTLVNIARLGAECAESLVRDFTDGTLSDAFDVPPPVRDALTPQIQRKRPDVAARLESILHEHGSLLPRHYWPQPMAIGTWKGGTVGLYLPQIRELYGEVAVRDIGLMASEGRMTLPTSDEGSAGVLEITSHYYEFVPAAEIDSPDPTVLGCHELQQGQKYFILLTTSSGLYRYNIYDLVRVVGFQGPAPILEFLNKGASFSSMIGEKLSEHQVVDAVGRALRTLALEAQSFVVSPRWGDPPGYVLMVESDVLSTDGAASRLAAEADAQLQHENIEYRSKRDSDRMAPLAVKPVAPGTWRDFDARRLASSCGTPEQYKHPFLVTEVDFDAQVAAAS